MVYSTVYQTWGKPWSLDNWTPAGAWPPDRAYGWQVNIGDDEHPRWRELIARKNYDGTIEIGVLLQDGPAQWIEPTRPDMAVVYKGTIRRLGDCDPEDIYASTSSARYYQAMKESIAAWNESHPQDRVYIRAQ